MAIRLIEDEAAAAALAERLNGTLRDRPIVVVTTPSGRTDPWIDAQEIRDEVGDVAEVVLMPTGPHSWAFSHRMPDQTQVYGGAARVYPVGLDWVKDLRRSPLRFAFDPAEGARATQLLIEDVASWTSPPKSVTWSSRPTWSGTSSVAGPISNRLTACAADGGTQPSAHLQEAALRTPPSRGTG